MFSYVYYASLIRISTVTIASLFESAITNLSYEDQKALVAQLQKYIATAYWMKRTACAMAFVILYNITWRYQRRIIHSACFGTPALCSLLQACRSAFLVLIRRPDGKANSKPKSCSVDKWRLGRRSHRMIRLRFSVIRWIGMLKRKTAILTHYEMERSSNCRLY